MVGQWTEGPGLAGSELYVFADRSYVYTNWSDLMTETVYDKGHWTLVAGLLTLSSDPEVVWDPRDDRRYLSLRESPDGETLLFGLEGTLQVFQWLVEDDPTEAQGYFRASCRHKARTWPDAEAKRLKAALMKCCWRPSYHPQ